MREADVSVLTLTVWGLPMATRGMVWGFWSGTLLSSSLVHQIPFFWCLGKVYMYNNNNNNDDDEDNNQNS